MTWDIDATHSHIGFSVRHMIVSWARGSFGAVRGTLNIDPENLADSWVNAEADAASINTGDANRDNHLRSADFFDVATYPTITFKSTKVEHVDGSDYKVTGDLTMHGVTNPVTFDVEYSGSVKDPYGLTRAGLNAKTKISRKAWGLTWHAALETGGAVVADEVKIELEVEAVKKAEASAQA